MSSSNLSPEIQEKILNYQKVQNQLRSLRIQIDAIQRQHIEMKQTLKELEPLDQSVDIYKMSGSILFKADLTKVKVDLDDKIEYANIQLQKYKKQEEKIKESLDELEQDLQRSLPSK